MNPMPRTSKILIVISMMAASTLTCFRSFGATNSGGVAAPVTNVTPGGRAFATLKIPKRSLYVGESVPITIRAYYSAGTAVTITGTPSASSTDFTLTVGDAAQGRATIGDEPYLAVTWKGRLSPARPGKYDLRIKIPSTLEWRTAPRAMPSIDDAFGNAFGDLDSLDANGDPFAAMEQRMKQMMSQAAHDFDMGPVQKKELDLKSASLPLNVQPLPVAGKPAAFSGAVGNFSIEASVGDPRVRAGEPVELQLVVRGQGNFDRVATTGVASSPVLETYPPTSTESAGSKTFVQPVVPRQAGRTEIPAVALDYFNPDTGRYATARSSPVALDVAPGQALAANHAGAIPDAVSGPSLAPNADDEGRPVASLRPLYTHRGFWIAQLAPLGALAAATSFVIRRRRVAADPRHALRASARKALRRYSSELERAFAAGDGPAFFTSARAALQQRLGALWGVVPETITLHEIERRVSGERLETLREVFDADAARFGPGATSQDLTPSHDAVRRILANPEAS